MNLSDIGSALDRLQGWKERVDKEREAAVSQREKCAARLAWMREAHTVLQTVSQMTQQQLEYHISELVSLALEAVFPDPYKMAVQFDLKRGRSEATLSFVRGEEKVHPMSASGGGPVDVGAFALRVALWRLKLNRSRPILILDEPFRYLSRDLQHRASAMLQEISKKVGLQLFIVTHEVDLLEAADTVFNVSISNGVSVVKNA